MLGPALVLIAAGEPSAREVSWLVVGLALVAQCLLDLGASTVREWLCRGIPPALHLRVFAQVAMIDACLTPVAVVVAGAGGVLDADAVIAIVPLLVLQLVDAGRELIDPCAPVECEGGEQDEQRDCLLYTSDAADEL